MIVTTRLALVLLLTVYLTGQVNAQPGGSGRGKQANQNRPNGQSRSGPKSGNPGERGPGQAGGGQRGAGQGQANGVLNQNERNELSLMREEEKLARDVYTALQQTWNARVFANISQAESQHMQAIGQLLAKYQIADPVGGNPVGVFTNPKYRQLYVTLVQAGSQSPATAFQVGLKIEEMDIADLRSAMAQTANPDLLQVYQRLEQGSMNHLRAFAAQLQRVGGSYQPSHLSPADFNQILNSSGGQGNGNGRGAGQGRGGTGGNAGSGNRQGPGGNRGRGGQSRGNSQGRGNGAG